MRQDKPTSRTRNTLEPFRVAPLLYLRFSEGNANPTREIRRSLYRFAPCRHDHYRFQVKARRAAVIFIIVTVTLDILAMGLIIPVLPRIILIFVGGKVTNAADWQGWFALVFALMQFVFSPVLGVLSDRFGRR